MLHDGAEDRGVEIFHRACRGCFWPALLDYTDATRAALWGSRIAAVHQDGVDGIALAAAQRWFSDDFRRRNPQVVESWRRTVASTAVPAYTGIARSIQSMDLRPMISTITCPTRIVCGDEDENTGPSVAASIARHIAGSPRHVVTGAGHFPSLERPIEFNAQLLQWLSPGCEDADRRH